MTFVATAKVEAARFERAKAVLMDGSDAEALTDMLSLALHAQTAVALWAARYLAVERKIIVVREQTGCGFDQDRKSSSITRSLRLTGTVIPLA